MQVTDNNEFVTEIMKLRQTETTVVIYVESDESHKVFSVGIAAGQQAENLMVEYVTYTAEDFTKDDDDIFAELVLAFNTFKKIIKDSRDVIFVLDLEMFTYLKIAARESFEVDVSKLGKNFFSLPANQVYHMGNDITLWSAAKFGDEEITYENQFMRSLQSIPEKAGESPFWRRFAAFVGLTENLIDVRIEAIAEKIEDD